MKLKPEQIMYVRSMGKALRITAVFQSAETANEYMEKHADEAVIAEFPPLILLANVHDRGLTIVEQMP